MGEFDNEFTLLMGSSIKECFVCAKLIDANPELLEMSINDLMRHYVIEQLVFMPGGSQQFDRFVVTAECTLRQALLHNTLVIDDLPPVLYMNLHMETTKQTHSYLAHIKNMLITTTLANLMHLSLRTLPTVQQCNGALLNDPFDWSAESSVVQASTQSYSSFREQQHLLSIGLACFTQYRQGKNELTKSSCIVGGLGVGKSTLLQLMALQSVCLGFNVGITALMSKRS